MTEGLKDGLFTGHLISEEKLLLWVSEPPLAGLGQRTLFILGSLESP